MVVGGGGGCGGSAEESFDAVLLSISVWFLIRISLQEISGDVRCSPTWNMPVFLLISVNFEFFVSNDILI